MTMTPGMSGKGMMMPAGNGGATRSGPTQKVTTGSLPMAGTAGVVTGTAAPNKVEAPLVVPQKKGEGCSSWMNSTLMLMKTPKGWQPWEVPGSEDWKGGW